MENAINRSASSDTEKNFKKLEISYSNKYKYVNPFDLRRKQVVKHVFAFVISDDLPEPMMRFASEETGLSYDEISEVWQDTRHKFLNNELSLSAAFADDIIQSKGGKLKESRALRSSKNSVGCSGHENSFAMCSEKYLEDITAYPEQAFSQIITPELRYIENRPKIGRSQAIRALIKIKKYIYSSDNISKHKMLPDKYLEENLIKIRNALIEGRRNYLIIKKINKKLAHSIFFHTYDDMKSSTERNKTLKEIFRGLSKLPDDVLNRINKKVERYNLEWDGVVTKAPELYKKRIADENLLDFLRRVYLKPGHLNGKLTSTHLAAIDEPLANGIRSYLSKGGEWPDELQSLLPPKKQSNPTRTAKNKTLEPLP